MEDLAVASKGEMLPTDETELLLHYLRSHDAVCPLCKYNLRNLTVPRCPECGRAIKIAVGLVEQVLWPYVTLLVGLLLPAGMGLLVWVFAIIEGLRFYERQHGIDLLLTLCLQASVFPAVLGVVFRRRFLKFKPRVQVALALSASAIGVGLFAAFVFMMR